MPILVARPGSSGELLCQSIRDSGGIALHFPFVEIKTNTKNTNWLNSLKKADIIIAVSQYAVSGIQELFGNEKASWPKGCIYLGVGQKTAHELSKASQQNVHYPEISDSEHLLQLPELHQVKGKNIIILRGNGGRELIEQTLTSRGARVNYEEVYVRTKLPISFQSDIKQWQDSHIDTLIVTSGEQLEHLVSSVVLAHETPWLFKQTLIVPSERILQQAKDYGFLHITNAKGASNTQLLAALQRLRIGLKHDQ
ncbi:uroporphyrinogen-III synthase [Vibrio sp. ZSDZ34]|jgi:uroporphyrinogen-III synthase|uniref:Uroporphyrinogen-III synthase n=1 Tax=Vibrio gelatinilyticus TaxID=2893468 RepID=A0A9X2B0M0_9VIBR|nr:uroporphyrinogen-III synthase [Vibrio gelatinilyticus]MCJ2378748.1 uroporphyrinogen-III synthase [Vibrio gelatinilyticus]